MGVRNRSTSKRRRTETTPPTSAAAAAAAGVVDLISDLSDELHVCILELLPDARDAVRTGALSRRWRGLWTRLPALRFDSKGIKREFINFVDDALALRATERETAMEHLAISFDASEHEEAPEQQLVPPPHIEAAQGWIHYAIQHAVKSLVFELDLPWPPYIEDEEGGDDDKYIGCPVMTLDGLVSSANLKTMRLNLGGAKLRLPSTAVFASLADLSIGNIEVEAGGVHLLTRLVSPACCPRLSKLRLANLVLPMEELLLIDAGALLELSLMDIYGLKFLELRTPSLRVLHVNYCYELEGLVVSALRIEDLKFMVKRPLHIDGDLSSVGRIKIELCSHGHLYDETNNGSIRLLECSKSARCLKVSLEVPKKKKQYVDIIKAWIPQLPHVTSLTIHVTQCHRRSSAVGAIASLLAQCNSIRYLSLNFCYWFTSREKKDSELPPWKFYDLSLSHLQEVEFKKLMGTDDELQFIQFILARATGIQKVAISLDDRGYWLKGSTYGFELMPPLDDGSWTACNDTKLSYKWRRCA